jgi:DNA modification methylase
MRRVTEEDYLHYLKSKGEVEVEGEIVKLKPLEVRRLHPEEGELTDVSTTVWSFPKRGKWATHAGDYRGNWPPQLVRALLLLYTSEGETVLDPMVGSGTTCVEAKLLGRNCIGVDVREEAAMLTLHRLYWLDRAIEATPGAEEARKARVEVYVGDVRDLRPLGDESVDMVATHPPYFNIIRYGRAENGDMSRARDMITYLGMLRAGFREVNRVLKTGKHFALLIGDTRRKRHYVPISHYALFLALEEGFVLREEIIKVQHRMKTTMEVWSKLRRDFLLIKHEKLFVFRKPSRTELRTLGSSAKQSFLRFDDV